MKMTISAAARLYGIHRSTLHRHIKSGRVTGDHFPDGSPALEFSELRRAYGEPPNAPESMRQAATADATPQAPGNATGATAPDTALLAELVEINRRQAAQLEALTAKVERLESIMRRLPAPESPREAPQATQETPPTDDAPRDPHGLRGLVDALRESNE